MRKEGIEQVWAPVFGQKRVGHFLGHLTILGVPPAGLNVVEPCLGQ